METNAHVKDLEKIESPIEDIIIVDNLPSNFRKQVENGIVVKSWYGN